MKRVMKISLYIIFVIIWICICCAIPIAWHYGFIAMLYHYWGAWLIIFAIMIMIGLIGSPIYLKHVLSGTWLHIIIPVLCSFIFIFMLFSILIFTHKEFSKFTPKKWNEFPNERVIMANDLKNHDIIGLNFDNVTKILGEPDEKYSNRYVYLSDFGEINIIFKENRVISIMVNE